MSAVNECSLKQVTRYQCDVMEFSAALYTIGSFSDLSNEQMDIVNDLIMHSWSAFNSILQQIHSHVIFDHIIIDQDSHNWITDPRMKMREIRRDFYYGVSDPDPLDSIVITAITERTFKIYSNTA